MNDNQNETVVAQPPPNRGALIGLVVLIALALGVLWAFSTQRTARPALERTEEQFAVKASAPPSVPGSPPVQEEPEEPQTDPRALELAQQLALMQTQGEIDRLKREQEERLKREQEAREMAAKRLAATPVVYKRGQSPAPSEDASQAPTSLGSGRIVENPSGGVAVAGEGADWLPVSPYRPGAVASQVPQTHRVILQGTALSAVLETRVESDQPGLIRAMIDEPVYSQDGTTLLIPAGTRLIGEYRSGLMQGQRRIMAVYNRLVTPAAITIDLASPVTSELGAAGLGGEVDTRFLERFGAAILLSFIEAEAQDARDSTAVYIDDANSAAEVALQDGLRVRPRLIAHQGSRITILVARDLYFAPQLGP